MVEARSTFEVISELLQRTALALSQNQKPSYSTITTSAPIEPFQQNLPPKPSWARDAAVLSTSSDCRSNDTLQIYYLTCHHFPDTLRREIGCSVSPARPSDSSLPYFLH